MPEQLIWFVGNRSPSITETITTDGAAVDLNSPQATVQFRMRPVGSSTLEVDAAATIVQSGSGGAAVNKGAVRYDWLAGDVDTAGRYLVWWQVTQGGKTQDLNEAVIEFRAHSPQANAYVELEELKSTLELTSQNFADEDLQLALVAASRGIDETLGQRFYLDAADTVRYYTASNRRDLRIDPLVTLTSVQVAFDGSTFDTTWAEGTDFVLEPRNALADGRPYSSIRRLQRWAADYYWPPSPGDFGYAYAGWWPSLPDAIKVTGKFGWAEVPAAIKQLTTMIATRLVRRTREAPFGIVAFGLDGAAVRASQFTNDPEYRFLTGPYSRKRLLV